MITAEPGWLLRAWESAQVAPPVARGAAIVAAAGLSAGWDDALDLPADELARTTAQLYELAFGPEAQGVLGCDSCGAELDVCVPMDAVSGTAAHDPPGSEQRRPSIVTLASGREVAVRVPTTRDLMAVSSAEDAMSELLGRCVSALPSLPPERGEPPATTTAIDETDRLAVDQILSDVAGAAVTVVRATCPECAARVSAPVDPATFLWERVRVAAPALLADVAELARSFGWRESDILALSPVRRSAYLSLVRGEAS